MEKEIELFADRDPTLRAYVYRMVGDRKVTPAVFIGDPFPGLWSHIRDLYGPGDYCIFIRRGGLIELVAREGLAKMLSD
ncbi:MAG: hypothetical protein WAU68_12290 [Vitreimonas sp.]